MNPVFLALRHQRLTVPWTDRTNRSMQRRCEHRERTSSLSMLFPSPCDPWSQAGAPRLYNAHRHDRVKDAAAAAVLTQDMKSTRSATIDILSRMPSLFHQPLECSRVARVINVINIIHANVRVAGGELRQHMMSLLLSLRNSHSTSLPLWKSRLDK